MTRIAVALFARATRTFRPVLIAGAAVITGAGFFARAVIVPIAEIPLRPLLLIAVARLLATLIAALVPATRGVLIIAVIAVLIVGFGPLVAIIAVIVFLPVAALAALFFEARAAFGNDPKIMIGKLQIILGHDPIARHLGITGERLVFFEQLRGIATCTIVDAIALFRTAPAIPLLALSTPTATAAGLTIIEQNQSLCSGC